MSFRLSLVELSAARCNGSIGTTLAIPGALNTMCPQKLKSIIVKNVGNLHCLHLVEQTEIFITNSSFNEEFIESCREKCVGKTFGNSKYIHEHHHEFAVLIDSTKPSTTLWFSSRNQANL